MAQAVVTPAPEPVAREDEYVRRILAADDFPAFSKVMSDLMTSLRDDDASAQRLANLVLRDYALTVKVIRTANTVHFNRSGRAVQSATHALMLLGARTVRDLASGLLLFEQYRRRSPGLKELMLLSLLTASHAREVAVRRGSSDPETAVLCGMFRNLGEVLAAAHLPTEYSEVLRRTKSHVTGPGAIAASRARAQATMAVLGCSFEDIGVAIARHWGMPDAVRRGMRAVGSPKEDPIELATAFGHGLATAIYREDEDAARDGVSKLLQTFADSLGMSREALAAIADAAVVETRETFSSAHVALDDLRLTRQIATAMSEAASRDAAAAAPAAPATGDATAIAATPGEPTGAISAAGAPLSATPLLAHAAVGAAEQPPVSGPALAALRERLAADLLAAVADVGTYEMQQALLVALEAALRGGPFDRVCFCAVDARAGELRARFGLGAGVEALVDRLALPFAATGTVGTALLRGEEVVLSLGTRLSIQEAAWLRGWGAASAGMFPVAVDGTTIGAVYVDRRTLSTGVDAPTLAYLRRVVASAAQALVVRRTATPAVAAPPIAAPPIAPALEPSPAPTVSTPPEPPPAPPVLVAAPAASPARAAVAGAAERADLVLRVLRGEAMETVVEGLDVTVAELARWREEFLAAAVARMARI